MSLRIHHLNCGTMCPWCEKIIYGEGSWLRRGRLVCHCLLLETPESLVLVDTGIGSQDVADPRGLGKRFVRNNHPVLSQSETAVAQVKALGFQPEDVRHIVATHLDVDHVGGLPDFPQAQVHVFKPELEPALNPVGKPRARGHHFRHGPRWVAYEEEGDSWFGFSAIRVLPDISAEVLLIPLPGHTQGHTGVAVRQGEKWLLHGGDAFFSQRSLENPPRTPWGLAYFERAAQVNEKARLGNLARLRQLAAKQAGTVEVFCSHDASAYERLRGANAARP